MRKNKRTPKELEELRKEVIQYYFNNPHANSSKYMQEKFKTTEKIIRDILSAFHQENNLSHLLMAVLYKPNSNYSAY